MIEQLIAEATECDFKVALEIKKPKSWLKSVSAFSNGIGGTLFFGVSDDRKPIGLSDVQKDAEAISRLIKERITPFVFSSDIITGRLCSVCQALHTVKYGAASSRKTESHCNARISSRRSPAYKPSITNTYGGNPLIASSNLST